MAGAGDSHAGTSRTVVVGASLAGIRVVETLRGNGHDGEIVLIGDEPHLPYDRPPLSKAVLTGGIDHAAIGFTDAAWLAANRIELRLGERATGLDLAARTVRTSVGAARYDDLVITTGARARNPFADAPAGVSTLRTIDDALRIRDALATAKHLVVVGGGFIGLEVASSALAGGTRVTVVEMAAIPLSRNIGADAATVLGDLARGGGTTLSCGRTVEEIRGGGWVESVVLDDGTVLECDAVVVGAGAVPNVEWLRGSGLDVTAAGLVCDSTGRAAPGVWAAGDVAAWRGADGRPRRHEHWTSAGEQAKLVAQNMLDGGDRTVETATYVWSDQFGKRISIVGDTGGDDCDEVRLLSTEPDSLAAMYSKNGTLVGACVVGQMRLVVQCRKWVATAARTAEIPEWALASN